MEYGLLGALEVRDDGGGQVDLGGRKARLLVATLLLADGRTLAADRLADVLWDGEPPPSAAGTLQSYVSRLRRLLEPYHPAGEPWRVLVSQPPGYRLVAADEEVDARRFARLADEGHSLLEADEPAKARVVLESALALWRGPALAEFADLEVAAAAAARLEDRRLAAMEDRYDALLRLGGHAALIGELTEAVSAHPLREGLCERLALALYRSGRQAEALAALDGVRRELRDQLGLDPGRPLQELASRILAQDPRLDPPAQVEVGGRTIALPAAARDGHLVGRGAELAQLRGLLTETLSGLSRFALVEGEPGIGKTRLQEEVAGWAVAEGATVVWGRCHEGDGAPAFWPWLEVLRRLLDTLPEPDRRAAATPALRQLLDASGAGPQGPPGSSGGFAAAPYALFGAVGGVLETVARRGPLVVLIDDLQWADPASAELLEFLAQHPSSSPVLVLASLRELEVGRADAVVAAVAAVTRRTGSRRLLVRGLDRAGTAELVAEVGGAGDLTEEDVDAVHDRAGGNPFYVTELGRLLGADGAASGTVAGVPAGVRDVVRQRVARLPDDAPSLLQVAAVAGRGVEVGLLATAAQRPLEQCLDALEPALAHRLLVPGDRPGTLRFAHALVRDAVLDDVPALRRARLHARVADALESGGGDPDDLAEIVAEHRFQAVPLGEGDRAAAALERAAGVAVRRFAYASADDLLERALGLRRASAGTPYALEAELDTIGMLVSLRRNRYGYAYEGRGELFARAGELARRLERLETYVGLLWAEFSAAGTTCDFEVAEPIAKQLLALAQESDSTPVQLVGHYVWGVLCWHYGRMAESREHLQVAVDLLRRDADEIYRRLPSALVETDALIHSFYGLVLVLTGDDGRAAAHFAGLRGRFTDPVKLLTVDVFEAVGAAALGDVTTAARAGASAHGNDPGRLMDFLGAAGEAVWGWTQVEQGSVDGGLARLDAALARFQATGLRTGLGLYLALRARALLLAGRPQEAADAVVAAEIEVDSSGERWPTAVVRVVRAQVEQALGAPAETVADLLREARGTALDQGQTALVRVAEQAARGLGVALT